MLRSPPRDDSTACLHNSRAERATQVTSLQCFTSQLPLNPQYGEFTPGSPQSLQKNCNDFQAVDLHSRGRDETQVKARQGKDATFLRRAELPTPLEGRGVAFGTQLAWLAA
jgi:hypothetical protein